MKWGIVRLEKLLKLTEQSRPHWFHSKGSNNTLHPMTKFFLTHLSHFYFHSWFCCPLTPDFGHPGHQASARQHQPLVRQILQPVGLHKTHFSHLTPLSNCHKYLFLPTKDGTFPPFTNRQMQSHMQYDTSCLPYIICPFPPPQCSFDYHICVWFWTTF